MNYIDYLGFFAGFLTTIALFPQVIKTWKEKSAKDLSLANYVILTTGMMFWLIYGFLRTDYALIASNIISICLGTILIFFKLRYG